MGKMELELIEIISVQKISFDMRIHRFSQFERGKKMRKSLQNYFNDCSTFKFFLDQALE